MSTLYDSVDYPGHPYADTHPRALAAVGRLFGLATKYPSSCRTLEIGCGDGANLVAMAYGLPGSEFVGIDLSARAIAKAVELARSVEVANVHLLQADLMEADPRALGAFDYVVAHGFYSWVPSPVRDRLMEVIARCPAPAGIAFVSYNAYPGFHLRQMLREMLLLHTRGAESPGQAIAGARALAQYLATGGEGDGLERRVLRSEA
ncbi:MAG TPA: class I SAM-dependent methyltransferase, partial [Burkholderiales bacterium]|nr:class I SAM-dependent methyltransferase [Burkholderiales bacterium]